MLIEFNLRRFLMSTVMEKAKSLIGHMLRNVHSSPDQLASAETTGPSSITVSSTSFKSGQPIPKRYTQEAQSFSPELTWQGVPAGAQELVLVCEDPDAPKPSPIVHWIVYNIPPTAAGLPEGIPSTPEIAIGARQGKNYNGTPGFVGPMPPLGHGIHHYHFQLFALDRPLNFPEIPDRDALVEAMHNHVLAQGELIGTYERSA